jgi:hypothetical protein
MFQWHSNDSAFQTAGLKSRVSVYDTAIENKFLLNLDSMKLHPDIPKRKEHIRRFLIDKKLTIPEQPVESEAIQVAEFETVESAFFTNQFDLCMMQALMLLQKYPGDPYLMARIGAVFLQLHIAKQNDMTSHYINGRTVGYSAELQSVNALLHTLTARECAELGYYAVSKSSVSVKDRFQYYTLWKLCEVTHRGEEQTQVAEAYRQKFDSSIENYEYDLVIVRKPNPSDFIQGWRWAFGF